MALLDPHVAVGGGAHHVGSDRSLSCTKSNTQRPCSRAAYSPCRYSVPWALSEPRQKAMVLCGNSTARSATERVLRKCGSWAASQEKNSRPVSRQRWSSGQPPSQWNHGTMPLATVCAIHSVVSAAGFATWRHTGRLLL